MLFPSCVEMERPFKHLWQSWTFMHSSVLASDAMEGIRMAADRVQWMHLLPDSRALCLRRGHRNTGLLLIPP